MKYCIPKYFIGIESKMNLQRSEQQPHLFGTCILFCFVSSFIETSEVSNIISTVSHLLTSEYLASLHESFIQSFHCKYKG